MFARPAAFRGAATFVKSLPRRPMVMSAWLATFGLVVTLGPPMTFTTTAVVLAVGSLALAIVLAQFRLSPPTIARVLYDVEAPLSK